MYDIKFTKESSDDIKRIDKKYQKALFKAFSKLTLNPNIGKPLTGKLKGLWKLRFSRYRIIYQKLEAKLIIVVFEVKRRKDVYRNR